MNWDRETVPDHELERLAAAAIEHRMIENVAAMAMTGWDLHDPDLLIAEIDYDSTTTGLSAAGVRGGGEAAMSYRAGPILIDFETEGGQLIGHVDPRPQSLHLETLEDQRRLSVDEHGRFSAPWFRGPNRLRAVVDGQSVATEWFLLASD